MVLAYFVPTATTQTASILTMSAGLITNLWFLTEVSESCVKFQILRGNKMTRDPRDARIQKLEKRIKDMQSAIEEANDHIADALDHANTYTKSDEVRPSALQAFDKAEVAHRYLTPFDQHRKLSNEDCTVSRDN